MTTIGPSLTITGDISSQEDITLKGSISGQLKMEAGALLVAPGGKVDADVHGTTITIHGTLCGTVTVAAKLELAAGACVTGTIHTPSLVLRDGATFNGTIDMPKHRTADKNPAGLKMAPPAMSDARAS